MISELDCRILAKACGLCWHEWEGPRFYKRIDETKYRYFCRICGSGSDSKFTGHPTYTTPDDWEMVRVKVVVPNMIEYSRYMALTFIRGDAYSVMLWMGKQTPENLCESVIEFIKSCPDLFPWVVEMMEGKE